MRTYTKQAKATPLAWTCRYSKQIDIGTARKVACRIIEGKCSLWDVRKCANFALDVCQPYSRWPRSLLHALFEVIAWLAVVTRTRTGFGRFRASQTKSWVHHDLRSAEHDTRSAKHVDHRRQGRTSALAVPGRTMGPAVCMLCGRRCAPANGRGSRRRRDNGNCARTHQPARGDKIDQPRPAIYSKRRITYARRRITYPQKRIIYPRRRRFYPRRSSTMLNEAEPLTVVFMTATDLRLRVEASQGGSARFWVHKY